MLKVIRKLQSHNLVTFFSASRSTRGRMSASKADKSAYRRMDSALDGTPGSMQYLPGTDAATMVAPGITVKAQPYDHYWHSLVYRTPWVPRRR